MLKKKGDEIYWIEVAADILDLCKRGGSGRSLGHVCLYLNTESRGRVGNRYHDGSVVGSILDAVYTRWWHLSMLLFWPDSDL